MDAAKLRAAALRRRQERERHQQIERVPGEVPQSVEVAQLHTTRSDQDAAAGSGP